MIDNRHQRRMIGVNVARLRKEQSLSKEMLSRMSGVSRPTIIRIEEGELDVKLSSVMSVADALCTGMSDLFADYGITP